MKKLLPFLILALFGGSVANARPQYSILQSFGTKCQNCHMSPHQGGIRSSSGFMARKDIALIKPETLGLSGFYDFASTNTAWDEKIVYGADVRGISARWPQGGGKYKRDYMLMQAAPYVAIQPAEWMHLEASYNFSYSLYESMRYPGQSAYEVSATFHFADYLPELRVGHFQPPVALEYDDHTMLVRQASSAQRSRPIIPCDYSELGVALEYEALPWLGVTLGAFDSKNLADATIQTRSGGSEPLVNEKAASAVARISFHPEQFMGLTYFFGGSFFINSPLRSDNGLYFANNYYAVSNAFFNFGMSDSWAVIADYMHSEKQQVRETNNFTLELNYQPMEGVIAHARAETANTWEVFRNQLTHTNQYVLGARFVLLPYLDIMPEYRVYDRQHVPDYAAQWSFNLHLFY
ncbi:MAG: hypothetical protein ACM3U1_01785 [Chloroflexota bacterium]